MLKFREYYISEHFVSSFSFNRLRGLQELMYPVFWVYVQELYNYKASGLKGQFIVTSCLFILLICERHITTIQSLNLILHFLEHAVQYRGV